MSYPLYYGTFVAKKKTVVEYDLSIAHPDISQFGTDALFAWKLLSDWVTPPDDGDDATLAKKYVKKVTLSPLKNGTVVETKSAWFTVKRSSKKKSPSVLYTIEVTDASLLDKIKVGDSDEVYQYVERKPAPAKKPAKDAAKPAADGAKSLDDLRDVTFTSLKNFTDSWSEAAAHQAASAARDGVDDARIREWLGRLPPDAFGRAAGRVAVERVLQGKPRDAEALVAEAEKRLTKIKKSEAAWRRSTAFQGLASAYWRLGRAKDAEKAIAEFMKATSHWDDPTRSPVLFEIEALGGRWDAAAKRIEDGVKGSFLSAGVERAISLARYESPKVFAKIVARLERHESLSIDGLGREVLRDAIERDEIEAYLDLALEHPRVFRRHVDIALSRLEAKDAAKAATYAAKVAAVDELYGQPYAVAIVAAHAPAKAAAAAKHLVPGLAKAALGKPADARKAMKSDAQRAFSYAQVTTDRELAIDALRLFAGARLDGDALVLLNTLGERDWVSKHLEAKLEEIRKLEPKRADHECRSFARAAAAAGRADLAFEAVKLPAKSVRDCSLRSIVAGAVSAGDWATAITALERIPDRDVNDRVSAALQEGLRTATAAWAEGPLALPLRVR